DQISLARRFAPRIIVSYDGDDAGKAAALRAISLCFENRAQIGVLVLPKGLDPDSYLKKHGLEKYQNLIKKSIPGLDFLIDSMLKKANIDIPEEKAEIARNIWNEIKKIPDSIVISDYIKKTSESLKIDETTLRSIIKEKQTDKEREEKGGFFQAEKRLLQILIENKETAPNVFPEMKKEDFQNLKSEPIFSALIELFKEGKESNIHELKQKIASSLVSYLTEILLEKEQESTIEEALDCLYTLRQLSLDNRAEKLKAEIARFERKG
ncbi:unnamed protein product, partial [marine sediment metagenome]